jgi:ATP-dependent protease ClpP protease subunit
MSQEIKKDERSLSLEYAFQYKVNLHARTIQLTGEIDAESFELVDTALTILENEGRGAITIKINSEGGSVYDAMAIVGRMLASKRTIVTEGYGSVMSAAGLILAAGDKRAISRVSWFMHHEFSHRTIGTKTSMEMDLKQLDREWKRWAELMEEFTNVKASKWISDAKLKDLYLTPEECLEMGIVDKII